MHREVNKNLFAGQSFYIGIDLHKKNWKVTILGQEFEHKTMSQDPNPKLLASYMYRNFPGGNYYAVYEAGFSGFQSCRKLRKLGIDCIVINPADVPTSRKEKLQKTDKADSRKLARSLRGGELEGIHIPDRVQEADRSLLRQRFRFAKDLARTKNRVKSLLYQFDIKIPERFSDAQSRHWSRVYMDWLKGLDIKEEALKQTLDNYIRFGEVLRKELLQLNRQVRKLSQTPTYQKNFQLLLSVPGVGLMIAMFFLVEIGQISRFKTQDELNNYIGLVPSMYGSGDKMRTGKIVKRGKKKLKIMLIEASWIAIRKDPVLMAKYYKLKKRMSGHKAIIRIARKMLGRIRHILEHQTEYVINTI